MIIDHIGNIGIGLLNPQNKLLQKIEELILYTIEQNKKLKL
jgi:hypothetical protein